MTDHNPIGSIFLLIPLFDQKHEIKSYLIFSRLSYPICRNHKILRNLFWDIDRYANFILALPNVGFIW